MFYDDVGVGGADEGLMAFQKVGERCGGASRQVH